MWIWAILDNVLQIEFGFSFSWNFSFILGPSNPPRGMPPGGPPPLLHNRFIPPPPMGYPPRGMPPRHPPALTPNFPMPPSAPADGQAPPPRPVVHYPSQDPHRMGTGKQGSSVEWKKLSSGLVPSSLSQSSSPQEQPRHEKSISTHVNDYLRCCWKREMQMNGFYFAGGREIIFSSNEYKLNWTDVSLQSIFFQDVLCIIF